MIGDELSLFVVVSDWHHAAAYAKGIRNHVFVVEQGVPPELELDEHDEHARHAIAFAGNDRPVGTGRLLADGYIGRMAVLQAWRGRGAGTAIMQALLGEARHLGMTELRLHAQTHAISFYEGFGFLPDGAQFMEAGIAHVKMRKPLAPHPHSPEA